MCIRDSLQIPSRDLPAPDPPFPSLARSLTSSHPPSLPIRDATRRWRGGGGAAIRVHPEIKYKKLHSWYKFNAVACIGFRGVATAISTGPPARWRGAPGGETAAGGMRDDDDEELEVEEEPERREGRGGS
eukprot:440796-Rhodomonas_salina.1